MSITQYSELTTATANWLNRSDLASRIPEFIVLAEARMRRDLRLRKIISTSITASEEYVLPTVLKSIIDLYHDGANNYGRIKIVSPGELGERKRRHGDTGVPMFAAVIDGEADANQHFLRFAPEPSGTYVLQMIYEADLEALNDSDNTTNWLLASSPDLYLFATLSLAEGYLQEDERVALWKQEYEQAADEYKRNADRREYGGALTPRPSNIIGEDV
jgi:hypothetical protein